MNKSILIVIAAIIPLAACGSRKEKPSAPISPTMASVREFLTPEQPCPAEAGTAAMYKLEPILGHVDLKSTRSLAAADKSIACLRPWAAALADSCQRKQMLEWLDYYDGHFREAKEKLAEGVRENALEQLVREVRERKQLASEWEAAHPFPKLPQCDDKEPALH